MLLAVCLPVLGWCWFRLWVELWVDYVTVLLLDFGVLDVNLDLMFC